MGKQSSAEAVIQYIQPGHHVFVHGGAATPNILLDALTQNAKRLHDVELIHLHTEGPATYAKPEYRNHFRVTNLFVGANIRKQIDFDRVDYIPCFLSEIPQLFQTKRKPLDVALLHLSPPDAHGFCTLGVSVDVARSAFHSADLILAQINSRMPRIHGDGFIHINDVDHYVEVDTPLFEPKNPPSTLEEIAIGKHVASLIEDGSCLQVGIGSIPNAVLSALTGHRHLGIHTEMWSDGVLELLRSGAIDNSRKQIHTGASVSSFIMGSQAVYDYIHDNPSVIQLGSDYVNDPTVIAQNPNVVAINSAVEIDITGQICADSVGQHILSGVGGQMDFMRGAALSEGGKPIIAITSRTKKGTPRIVPTLQAGAGVVTTRAHAHYIVTEYGVADLFGKTLSERARALIAIAHPEDREALLKGAHT